MLPIIDENIIENVLKDAMIDIHSWRKKMIHYVKDVNPEINSAIIEIAQNTDLHPKAVATGAYMTYLLLEKASHYNDSITNFEE